MTNSYKKSTFTGISDIDLAILSNLNFDELKLLFTTDKYFQYLLNNQKLLKEISNKNLIVYRDNFQDLIKEYDYKMLTISSAPDEIVIHLSDWGLKVGKNVKAMPFKDYYIKNLKEVAKSLDDKNILQLGFFFLDYPQSKMITNLFYILIDFQREDLIINIMEDASEKFTSPAEIIKSIIYEISSNHMNLTEIINFFLKLFIAYMGNINDKALDYCYSLILLASLINDNDEIFQQIMEFVINMNDLTQFDVVLQNLNDLNILTREALLFLANYFRQNNNIELYNVVISSDVWNNLVIHANY